MNEKIGIVTFDKNTFYPLQNLSKLNENYFQVITINDFSKIDFNFNEDLKIENFKIIKNEVVVNYIKENFKNINKIYCITNNDEYKDFIAYEIYQVLKYINPNISVHKINLNRIDNDNLNHAIKTSKSVEEKYYKYYIVKKLIDKISGILYSKVISNEMKNKNISISHSSLNLFCYLYKIKKNIKKNKYFEYCGLEVISEDTLNIDSIKLNEIIANILKMYPALEIGEVIDEIKKYYYGIRNKDGKFENFISYTLTDKDKETIKNILETNGIEYINKENYSYSQDMSNLFAIQFDKLPDTNDFYKMIYKSLIVYTLFYFAKIPVIKEKILYDNGRKESIFYSTYFTEETINYFRKNFQLENWEVNTILNKHLKVKNIKYIKNSVNMVKILYNIDYYNNIYINLYNIDYYIKKLQENGLVKNINNEIIFTKKSENIYRILNDLGLLNIINYDTNEELHNEIINNLDNLEILEILEIYLNKIEIFFKLYNTPSKKQIELLHKIINENIDVKIPNEAFTNKNIATKIISENLNENLPSQKQILLAKDISKKINKPIDESILKSNVKLSQWIYDNKPLIKRPATQKMKNLALKLAKEYNIDIDEKIFKDFNKTQNFINKLV